MSDVRDRWAAGSTYEAFMGRWSRRLAFRYVEWLDIPPGAHWLDVGCGTGALTAAICHDAAPASVVACDPAEPFIEYARGQSPDAGRNLPDAGGPSPDARVTFVVAGAGQLPTRPAGYGCVASLLALNFFPDPGAAVREMARLASAGGTVSAAVWDYAGGMQFLRRFWDAAVALDPAAREWDEGERFPLCRPAALEELFRAAGLDNVWSGRIDIPTEFADFDDYWRPLLGGTGPAPSYVASLPDGPREALARQLETTLPRGADGSIALVAGAWVVRGRVS